MPTAGCSRSTARSHRRWATSRSGCPARCSVISSTPTTSVPPRSSPDAALDAAVDGFHLDVRLRHADGHAVWVELDASLVHADGAHGPRLVLHVEDISGRKEAEATGRDAVARFQATFTHTPIGMAIVELDGGVRDANPGLCRMLGLEAEIMRASNLLTLTDPDDTEELERQLGELREGRTRSLRVELRLVAADGHTLWTLLSAGVVEDDDGRPAYLVAQAEDITERRSAEHDLVHQTLHDPLTGLGNRLLLKDQLHQAPRSSVRSRSRSCSSTSTASSRSTTRTATTPATRSSSVSASASAASSAAATPSPGSVATSSRSSPRASRTTGPQARWPTRCELRSAHPSTSARSTSRSPRAWAWSSAAPSTATGDQLLRDAGRRHVPRQGRRARSSRAVQRRDPLAGDRASRDRADAARRARRRPARLLYQPIVDLHTGRPTGAEALLRIADPDQGMLRPRRSSRPRRTAGSSSTSVPGCSTGSARSSPSGPRTASATSVCG